MKQHIATNTLQLESKTDEPKEDSLLTDASSFSTHSISTNELKSNTEKETSVEKDLSYDVEKNLLQEYEAALAAEEESSDKVKKTFCQKLQSTYHLLKGYFLAMLFAVCTACASILMKKSFTLSGSDSSTIRYFVQFVTMFIVLKYKHLHPFGPKKERKLLTYRGLAGILGLMCGFFAIKFINPSDFKAINHSSILITAVLARIFLKEKLTFAHIFAFIMTIIGVFLISKPTFLFPIEDEHVSVFSYNMTANYTELEFESMRVMHEGNTEKHHLYVTIGVTFALMGAFGGGSAKVLLKKLCTNKVHFSVATIYASYYGLPISVLVSVILTATGVTHSNFREELPYLPLHLFYTVCAAFVGVLGQVFLNLSLKYEDTSKLSLVKTVDVFFAFILQKIFLGIEEDWYTVAGAITIVGGAFLILLLKVIDNQLNKKKKKGASHKENKCVKFVLLKF